MEWVCLYTWSTWDTSKDPQASYQRLPLKFLSKQANDGNPLENPPRILDTLSTQIETMSNVEILISGMLVTFIACVGVLCRTLGYDESKNKKTFEIDTDLGAIQKYGK